MKRLFYMKRGWGIVSVCFAILLISGCKGVNTADVQKFSALSVQAGDKFPAIARDVVGSCERRSRYESMRSGVYDVNKQDAKAEADCADYIALEPRIVAANRVLPAYLSTMGRLASNKPLAYSTGLQGIASGVTAVGHFGSANVKATVGIANLLTGAITGEWRRKKLKTVIKRANPDVQVLSSGLILIVGTDYKNLLDLEEDAARKFFLGSIKENEANTLDAILVERQWEKERQSINDKRQAADAYVSILKEIAEGHQKLNDNKLNAKEVGQMMAQYSSDAGPWMEDLKKAF